MSFPYPCVLALLIVGCANLSFAQDTLELLNGTSLQGEILEIRKADKEFDFKTDILGRSVTQTYPYSKVHAVTFKGKRFEITPMPSKGETGSSESDAAANTSKSKDEVLAEIESVGASDPDWMASTPLNHPKSLDLKWPIKVEGPWNESKNVGQYIWGRVNPNVSRWRSGIKLVYECMKLHQGDDELLQRDYQKLGNMYFTLLQDYPRAAYWLMKSGASVSRQDGIHLVECYYRLGSKEMAMEAMRGQALHFNAIKLLGEMGEIEEALNVTNYYAKTNVFNEAFLLAADALRSAGRLDEAIEYYQKILDKNQARNEQYLARYKGRAADSINSIQLFDKADVSKVQDGTYVDKAVGYNGDLEVQVTVKGSRISDVKVTKHQEKQFYAALTDTPDQIIEKQSIRDIDGTSGATITSVAIVNATARALAQGAK